MAATTVRDAPAAAPDETEPPAPAWWARLEVWGGTAALTDRATAQLASLAASHTA